MIRPSPSKAIAANGDVSAIARRTAADESSGACAETWRDGARACWGSGARWCGVVRSAGEAYIREVGIGTRSTWTTPGYRPGGSRGDARLAAVMLADSILVV